jgi:subtilisin family serine protease
MLEIEVVPTPEPGKSSMFAADITPTADTVDDFKAPKGKLAELARRLGRNGFTIRHIGEFSVSAACPEDHFERFFATRIDDVKLPVPRGADELIVRAPLVGTSFQVPKADSLDSLIERAYVQHEPTYFADERPLPPFWNDKFRLRVPGDVAQILRAASVHQKGISGKGVRVAMPDTGFYRHPYYIAQGYNFLAVTAPDALDQTTDAHGHGTGECANLFAVAPGINFVGVKMNNPTLAFATAVQLRPQVMTNSWGYHADVPGTTMPNFLKPLYLTILDAVAQGITVCFSAGNGHFAFPACIPEVIAAGGVVVGEDMKYSATPYASGFESTWFPGRRVPDVCGLCGTPPAADYLVLPVAITAALNKEAGWGAFSGTSAASPMVAGVCALLKEAQPSLTPVEIKHILMHTARDITTGTCGQGHPAAPGPDLATGFGLVDADRAIDVVL